MSGCKTRTMAIALDGGFPEDRPPGAFPGQQRLTALGRRREPVPERPFYLAGPHAQIPAAIAPDAAADKLARSEHPAPAAADPSPRPADAREFDPRLVKQALPHAADNSR